MTQGLRSLIESEAGFQKRVIDFAILKGWLVHHSRKMNSKSGHWFTPIGTDHKGFPDLVMVKPPVLIIWELKSENGAKGEGQQDWEDAFGEIEAAADGAGCMAAAHGYGLSAIIHTGFKRPSDWPEIQAILEGKQ